MNIDEPLLWRVEDASLNASAPRQQRWLDGWLLRYSPGTARRARCINAVAAGRLPWQDKLRLAQVLYGECGLPLVMRITQFTEPADLDAHLAGAGWARVDDVQVLVYSMLKPKVPTPPPAGMRWHRLDAHAYAAAVGNLRGSTAEQQHAHADRLQTSPVPYHGLALINEQAGNGTSPVLACGQFAREGELVGLYDVHTHPQARNRGLAGLLCEHLLSLAANDGATVAYLQVEADNHAAQAVYRRLGFTFGYGYHYRQPQAPG